MIVVDASAVVEALFAPGARGEPWDSGEPLCVPHLLDVEVAQVVRRQAAAGVISSARAVEALADLASMPLMRFPHYNLLERIWELRHSFTAYDAAYVALAESLDAVLVTKDRRTAAAHGHRARIKLV